MPMIEKEENVRREETDYVKAFWITLLCSFAVGVVLLCGFPLFKTISADGKADYCYVEPVLHTEMDPTDRRRVLGKWVSSYQLMQHVPWRSDRILASELKTTEDARMEAEKFGCPIR